MCKECYLYFLKNKNQYRKLKYDDIHTREVHLSIADSITAHIIVLSDDSWNEGCRFVVIFLLHMFFILIWIEVCLFHTFAYCRKNRTFDNNDN